MDFPIYFDLSPDLRYQLLHVMLSSILIYKQLNYNNKCTNSILLNSQSYSFCQKAKNINNIKLQQELHVTQKQSNMFLYTTLTQKLEVDVRISNENVNAFALFGFNLNTNVVRDSLVNISLGFEVFRGALVCIKCDVEIYNCSLVFIASGKELSGLVGEAPNSVFLQQSLIQYRLASMHASGIVNRVDNANANITIVDCNLTGSNLIKSDYSGYIACEIASQMNMTISSFMVCVDSNLSLGNQSANITFNGAVTLNCDVCGGQMVVYGLCGDSLQYALPHSGMLTCDFPFEFVDGQCQCTYGYLLDGSVCVNVIEAIHNMSSQMLNSNQVLQIQLNISNMEQKLQQINTSLNGNITSFSNILNSNNAILEQYILGNYSQVNTEMLDNMQNLEIRMTGNITALNISVQSSINALNNSIASNFNSLDQYIFNNISQLNSSINNCSAGIKIMNDTILNVSTLTNQQFLALNNSINNISSTIQNVNSTTSSNYMNINSSLIDSQAVIDYQQLQVQLLIFQSQCLNSVLHRSHFVDNFCVQTQAIYKETEVCSSNMYVQIFDLFSVTQFISNSGNFSSGYVFSSSTIINNAFIDVSDDVYYSPVQPLFQNQNAFNSIKIQIGRQFVDSGSLLTTSSSLTVNQMNVVSKIGSQITVNSAQQFNIFLDSSTSVNIVNLLVNLSFTLSDGNIALINNIAGVLNVSGYQICGQYQSTSTVAMIGRSVSLTTLYIKLVSFSPDVYNVGSQSSYLISNAADSILNIDGVAIILGNATYYQNATQSSADYYFGGIVTNIAGGTSVANIKNVIVNSYQYYNTNQLMNFGFIVGTIQQATQVIKISNICFQQTVDCMSSPQFTYAGLIGQSQGTLSLQSCNVLLFFVSIVQLNYFGIIGMQNSNAPITEIINMKASLNVSSSTNRYAGVLIGYQTSKNCTILNVSVSNSSISSGLYVGGIIGYVSSVNQTIINTTVFQSNISGLTTYVGGFIGQCQSTKLIITSSVIQSVRLTGTTQLGLIIGGQSGTALVQTITTSLSTGSNFVNGVSQANCASFTSALLQKGC
ncbi:Hypothetical_protein [Hexamita inflata]|uniref:Hypothetical_protein n=1 Tax=Hexamita inflata TaxID=28002 RepID=A0AA86PAW4_9EUKA|nr:Hypothetical protein HINF_LOCUS20574 [Hexamita inflata]